jgi:hypothetical protein
VTLGEFKKMSFFFSVKKMNKNKLEGKKTLLIWQSLTKGIARGPKEKKLVVP